MAPPTSSAKTDRRPTAAPSAEFGWFSVNVGSWFGAWGLQQVIFSWILVGELHASGEWVGVAQTSIMLPALVFILAGGVLADRSDPRRILMILHTAAALPMLVLALSSAAGWIEMWVLLVYGGLIGTAQAFSMPARDKLLSQVAGNNMMQAVTVMTAVQFSAQALGALLAGLARIIGSAPMLVVQALIVFSGAWAARFLPRSAPVAATSGRIAIGEIREGLRVVAQRPALRLPVAMVVAVGLLFVGPYTVIFPLLVRDYYQAGIGALSLVLMMFPLGTIVGSLLLRRRGIRRKGRAALWALGLGAFSQSLISTGVPFFVMVALTLIWGLCGSVFINCTRTLFQEGAPLLQRGRVLAVYQLGFTGGAPLGALLSGFLSTAVGLHTTLLVSSALMVLLALTLAIATEAPRLE